jgi:uncharacterized protein (TIGR02001 family)
MAMACVLQLQDAFRDAIGTEGRTKNMRKWLLACTTAILAVAGTNALAADEKDAVDQFFDSIGKFSGTVAGTTDYTFRGISQTNEGPAVQGSFGWSKDFAVGGQTVGLYASAWGSNVKFKDGDNGYLEIDYTGGITTTVKGLKLDAFGIYYTYPDSNEALNYDYVEAGAGAGYDFGFANLTGQFFWSPDYFGGIGDAYYFSGNVSVPLPFKLTAAAHIGYNAFDAGTSTDYADWSISITRNILGFDLSVAYVDTDLSKAECFGNSNCDARGVFTIAKAF